LLILHNKMKPILEIHNVSKKYRIQHQAGGYLSLRERVLSALRFEKQNVEDFWALNDVSFDVQPGQSIGVIGRNGAGKSTLLKVLSKITPPTKGKIISRGRIASLLEVGTGFHPELTGRENIFFNGSLLGMKHKEIEIKFDEIVDFSGVEKFLDTPLKHYSSGMQLRLAFAVAAFLEPEILIIDEVLAVGDAEFQKKCLGKMEDVSKSGRTILFVSHDLNAISNLCRRTIVLKNGSVAFLGETLKGISFYQEDFKKSETFSRDGKIPKKPIYFKNISVRGSGGQLQSSFLYDQDITLDFEIIINEPSLRCDLFVMVLDARKKRLFALESNHLKSQMAVVIEAKTLVRGNYSICAFINQPNIARIDEAEDVCNFEIIDNGSPMLKHGDYDYGGVFGRGKWK
jgi:lipopolysaccharide transport system ATP-binding protein